jgi:tRNA/rRNA methyltransferase
VAPRWANVLRREETLQRASGANEVLSDARIVATLDEALSGIEHLCATVMTPRDFGPPTLSPRQHFANLLQKRELERQQSIGPEADLAINPPVQSIAFLFGSERFGMSNEDVYRCHAALSIPTNPNFGSLNLAAALQLIAYDWRQALGGFAAPDALARDVADAAQVAGMLAHLEQALVAIDFLDPAAPKKLMPRLNQLFNRAELSLEEIHILRGIAKAAMQAAAARTKVEASR